MNKSCTHSSRCIHHVRMGKSDDSDCAGVFKPCPLNQTKHTWDTDLKQLSLQRDDCTKLICHIKCGYFVISV